MEIRTLQNGPSTTKEKKRAMSQQQKNKREL